MKTISQMKTLKSVLFASVAGFALTLTPAVAQEVKVSESAQETVSVEVERFTITPKFIPVFSQPEMTSTFDEMLGVGAEISVFETKDDWAKISANSDAGKMDIFAIRFKGACSASKFG